MNGKRYLQVQKGLNKLHDWAMQKMWKNKNNDDYKFYNDLLETLGGLEVVIEKKFHNNFKSTYRPKSKVKLQFSKYIYDTDDNGTVTEKITDANGNKWQVIPF